MAECTYLPLLNTIAVNECRGEAVFAAWAATARDPELRAALQFVAIREGEHAAAFRKRLCELGQEVCEAEAESAFRDLDGLKACLCDPGISDADKARRFAAEFAGRGDDDPLARIFADTTIDPRTAGLLGRFIAEERDSARRLAPVLRAVQGRSTGPAAADLAEIAGLRAAVEALRAELGGMRRIRSVV